MKLIKKMKKYEKIKLINYEDEKGSLVAIGKNINKYFKLKRVFYIYDVKTNIIRGAHANKNSKFIFIALSGSCKININDGGKLKETFILNSPDEALYIDKMIWKEMYDFESNTILLVLSSHCYDDKEYIKDYNAFKKMREI